MHIADFQRQISSTLPNLIKRSFLKSSNKELYETYGVPWILFASSGLLLYRSTETQGNTIYDKSISQTTEEP